MKTSVCLIAVLFLIQSFTLALGEESGCIRNGLNQGPVLQNFNSRTMAFTENLGQWDEQIRFRVNAGGATMWFTEDGAYYQFIRRVKKPGPMSERQKRGETGQYRQLLIKASFVGANPDPVVVGEDMMEYKCNYFKGNDPGDWFTDVPNYRSIRIKEIYSGIDLKYYGNEKRMEYDFIVSPGADLSKIEIAYEGVNALEVNEFGELEVETDWGRFTEMAPLIFQVKCEDRIEIAGRYILRSDNSFGFALDEDYNNKLALVIDPVLTYSTYLGGSGYEDPGDVEVDGLGQAIVCGSTSSTDFPTVNAFDSINGGSEIYVTKYSADGSSMIFSTFIGGSGRARGMALDGRGNICFTGDTYSSAFPIVNGYDDSHNGHEDAFIVILSSSGNSILYSTFLGGSEYDRGQDLATYQDYVCIVGYTDSENYPTANAYQDTLNGDSTDAFITMWDPEQNMLVFSTYLGGTMVDEANGISMDSSGNVYLTGVTESDDFPTVNAYDDTFNFLGDPFIAKLNPFTSTLIYSTYYGGGGSWDRGYAIDVDPFTEEVYMTGITMSSQFPVVNAFQTSHSGGDDAFIVKFNAVCDSIIYASYYGGSDYDGILGLAVDNKGYLHMFGNTKSQDFPLVDPLDDTLDDLQVNKWDAIIGTVSPDGGALLFSTYMGGNDWDYCTGIGGGIACDSEGNIYVTGKTESLDFPTASPLDPDHNGYEDAFVAKIELDFYICGDANSDESVNVSDAVTIINYVFAGGDPPEPLESGDANCDGTVNVADAVWVINYVFAGGHEPCDTDGDGEPDC